MAKAKHCDYCSSPVFDSKDMSGYTSNLCERHYFKVLEMAVDDEMEDY